MVLTGGTVETTGGLAFSGMFEIVEGTGRFEDISGSGGLRGQFTCLPSTLERNMADSCEDLGAFSEFVFESQGSFADPTA